MLLLFFGIRGRILIEFGSFHARVPKVLPSTPSWAQGRLYARPAEKGACSRQVPFLYNKDAPERRTPSNLSLINGASPVSIDTATGKEAPADISSGTRERHLSPPSRKKYERFNAISSFGAYKTWLAGMMRQAPIDENADVLDIAGGTGDAGRSPWRARSIRAISSAPISWTMMLARMH